MINGMKNKTKQKILRASPAVVVVRLFFFIAGRISVSLVLKTQRVANARRHAGSRQLRLLACVFALRSACTYFAALCMSDCAVLCCAVLCCGRCSTRCYSSRKELNMFL